MSIKERKIFSLENFRGLDTENKPLKVKPFRATEGENFIIDSNTLKTRPGFTFFSTPILDMEDGDEIIDVYNFRGVELVITNRRLYINGKYNDSRLISSNSNNLYNFKDKQPLFQEEKDCLFIFCIDGIYVFSIIYSGENLLNYVFYELRNKPNHNYDINDKNLEDSIKTFNDLPTPYEPTIFIGDKAFDDVNLLSNVTKYEVFGQSSNNTGQESINTITLPTHYDASKHGDLKPVKIDFYKDNFGDLSAIPLYKGIIGDTFILGKREDGEDKTLADYGRVLNEDNPIKMANIFYPLKDFESYEKEDGTKVVISQEINLNANDFFSMTTKEEGQNIYQFLLDYLKMNNDLGDTNTLLAFELKVIANVKYKDFETQKHLRTDKVEYKKIVYVQLYKYEETEIGFSEPKFYETHKVTTTSLAFPPYPIIDETANHTLDITPSPIRKKGFSLADFKGLVQTAMISNSSNPEFKEEDVIRMNGRYYDEELIKEQGYTSLANPGYYQDWRTNGPKSVGADESSYPPYPPHPQEELIIDVGKVGGYGRTNSLQSSDYIDISNKVLSLLKVQLAKLPPSDKVRRGYVKFRYYRYWDDGQDSFYEEGWSSVDGFSFKNDREYNKYTTQSFSSTYEISFNKANYIVNDLYTFKFVKEKNAFELKMKNYFYDFNNEPSISVKVEFTKNPDYDIIAKSRFGTTFGSENRLFLAGNKDTPHIDRFNVSNDLLGNNEGNQSYELSYFPSKNYRVLGGKGAINSYVTATDTQLYITKEAYPNDQNFFIRERMLDEKGLVGYKEYKTSIDKTSINNNTIVRFYNDMLMLDESGLYGIEIASNVLTNERLLKMRSSFVNNSIIEDIKKVNKEEIFIYEDNFYMYIFIGKNVYVADSRYLAFDENGENGNYNYELVKWTIPIGFKKARVIKGRLMLISNDGTSLYTIEENKSIDELSYERDELIFFNNKIQNIDFNSFIGNISEQARDIVNLEIYDDIYMMFASRNYMGNEDFIIGFDGTFNILNDSKFYHLQDGDFIYFGIEGNQKGVIVSGLEESQGISFKIDLKLSEDDIIMYNSSNVLLSKNVKKKNLVLDFSIVDNEDNEYFILSDFKHREYFKVKQESNESIEVFLDRVKRDYIVDSNYIFAKTGYLKGKEKVLLDINLKWVSPLLDFGNQLFEKTMFKTMIYGTKQEKENKLYLGYKTMRRSDRLGTPSIVQDFSNSFDFDNVDFNLFAINTFNEFGASIPTKENNFLYIQFVLYGKGNIEVNGLNFLYKNNRMLKTIG